MRSLGISIQPDGFSFALCDGSLKKHTLAAAGSGRLDGGSGDPRKELGRKLSAALKEAKASKFDRVTVSLPSIDVALRELSLPFSERDKVMQVLKFELESDLFHIDIDEVVCDFIELQDDRATSTLLVAAQPKESIQTGLDILEAGGLDSALFDLDYAALASIAAVIPAVETGAADQPDDEESSNRAIAEADALYALLWVGPYCSVVLIHNQRGVRHVRTLHVGYRELGRGLDSSVPEVHAEPVPEGADETDLHAAESAEAVANEALEELAENEGDSDPEIESESLFGVDGQLPTHQNLTELLRLANPADVEDFRARLVAELRRGLIASSLQLSSLTVVGGQIPELDQLLGQRLGIPIGAFSFDRAADPVAIGAALRGLGDKSSSMNMRQEEYRYTRGLERIEGPLTFALVGLIAFFVLTGVVDFKRGSAMMNAAAGLDPERGSLLLNTAKRVEEILNDKLPENAPNSWRVQTSFEGQDIPLETHITKLYFGVEEANEQLDELFGTGTLEMPQSCLEAWRLISDVLKRELDGRKQRWMLESLAFTSVDSKGKTEAHVKCDMVITILDDQASLATKTGESLQRAFQAKDWILEPPVNNGWGPPEEGAGSSSTITLLISVKKSKAEKSEVKA
jgi:Tfp pilus assembly PilM family ATPase